MQREDVRAWGFAAMALVGAALVVAGFVFRNRHERWYESTGYEPVVADNVAFRVREGKGGRA